MRVELPRYTAYHASRVSWAKQIPVEWETGWLGECSAAIQTGPFGSQLHATEYVTDEIPVINPSNIVNGRIVPDWEITVDSVKADSLARHRFRKGDIVFARRGEMGRCAPIGDAEVGWLCGTGSMLVRLKEHRLLPRFASLLLSQAGVKDTLSLESVGATMDNLNTRILAKIRIPVPPLPDQWAILTFLDRETAKIDRLMAVRQKQVECLQEQRSAVIHHAVTKGLDPQAKMKPSGHPWLEEIPAHWDTYRLKFIAKLNPGKSASGYSASDTEKVVFLPMECVSTAGAVDQSNRERICDLWKGFTYFAKGDVVVAKITPCFENGKGALLSKLETDIGFGTTEFHVVRAGTKLVRQFLYLITASYRFRGIGERFMTGAAGQQRVSEQFIADFPIALPPPDEQQSIVTYIERETAKLDTLIAKYQRELELLAEYRASLISHAVTGKIDVRGLVEPEALEPA